MRTGISISLSPAAKRRLDGICKDRNAAQKHVWRAEIVLLSVDGVGTNEIMRRTGKSKTCVWRWQERFMHEGVEGLLRDKTRPSRIAPLAPQVAEQVVARTLEDPPGETTHWAAPMMATKNGISVSSVQRIWRAHGLQPHRVRQFKLSNDPKFVEKLRDVVGLYVSPPAHAIVLSFDEKSQIQALDRSQPGLPLKKGRAGTMTHDYKRNGTTTLFAALNVLDGTVNHYLLMALREANGREASPSAGVIDSQSVKTTESGGPRGYDAGKKTKGRKRHIITDTQGFLVGAVIHAADIQDRDGAPDVLASIRYRFPWLRHVFADGGYAGDKLRAALAKIGKWTLEIIKRSDHAKGFVLLPRRWVVERTFAWLNRNRRLAKDFERTIESATAWLFAASVQMLTRRFARPCNHSG